MDGIEQARQPLAGALCRQVDRWLAWVQRFVDGAGT
ncbi:hypothetical protein Tther_00195 [Tepidimonas thermarum]|uniref:Uncharacterized protein n=1 Tax=Tepidimonas thermarum TaxID=335431 RepID=A0A554X835_9BURK|nr:hypothetical protein Tther_00195 [Tepidimonas thermarum]